MSNGVSNISFPNSSSSSSSSAVTKVENLIKTLDQKCLYSCVIGISKIKDKYHNWNHNISHTALLLSSQKANYLEKKEGEGTEGIILEYGKYPPDTEEEKKKEEDFVKRGYVIYRYGEKGGLRYYANSLEEFKKTFGDIGYICLDIHVDNQKSFSDILGKIAPISENKWIKANYNSIGLFGKKLNCQTFTAHALDILKPKYDSRFISKGKETDSETIRNGESIIPDDLLNTLRKYE